MPEVNGLIVTGGLVYDHDGDVHRPAEADVLIEGDEIVRIEPGLANRVAGEGKNPRVLDARDIIEISLGDFVLSGGEPAALALIDACVRLLPGVMGADASLDEESFTRGLLEYPHYTRPADWCGRRVPDVLLSGHHENICAWRNEQAETITRDRRPDLWDRYQKDLKNQKEHSHERD